MENDIIFLLLLIEHKLISFDWKTNSIYLWRTIFSPGRTLYTLLSGDVWWCPPFLSPVIGRRGSPQVVLSLVQDGATGLTL